MSKLHKDDDIRFHAMMEVRIRELETEMEVLVQERDWLLESVKGWQRTAQELKAENERLKEAMENRPVDHSGLDVT